MRVFETIREILIKISGLQSIQLTDNIQNDLAMDSLAMVMLLIEIEECFGIELDESDMNPLELILVSDVVDLVERYMNDEE